MRGKRRTVRVLESWLLRSIHYICTEKGRGDGELEETAQWGASSFVRLNKYSVDEIMENKMDESCGTHGGEEKIIRDFGGDA